MIFDQSSDHDASSWNMVFLVGGEGVQDMFRGFGDLPLTPQGTH